MVTINGACNNEFHQERLSAASDTMDEMNTGRNVVHALDSILHFRIQVAEEVAENAWSILINYSLDSGNAFHEADITTGLGKGDGVVVCRLLLVLKRSCVTLNDI